MKHSFLILIFCFGSLASQAQFYWNKNCQEAFSAIIQLKFTEGKLLLDAEKSTNSENKLPHFIENYIDYLQIQIGEERNDFDRLVLNKESRLSILEAGEDNSPWFLYTQAELHLQWAGSRLKFGEYLTAAYEINKAYRLLIENQERYPNFVPNLKSLGILHALIGSVPDSYSWVLNIIGMEGHIAQGMNEMQAAIDSANSNPDYRFLLEETYFMYSFLKLNLQNDPEGLQDILNNIKDSNYLLLNFAANRIATKLGQNELAIEILSNRKQDETHYPFLYLEYLLGIGKQNKLDPTALKHFEKYTQEFKGLNYLKSAYMHIGWQHILEGDTLQFKSAQNNIQHFGNTLVDADKEAQKTFEQKRIPQANLLQARLLFDGGYYKKAATVLEQIENPQSLTKEEELIEYYYRKGRIEDALKDTEVAKENYLKAIEIGRYSTYYYAAKSALQIALIWEKKGNLEKAHFYFDECIAMENHEYEQSIEQKAKAGLHRISKVD